MRTSASKEADIFMHVTLEFLMYSIAQIIVGWLKLRLLRIHHGNFPWTDQTMSISRHRINSSFRNSFRSFTSKKKNIQMLIWQYVYARNFYCFNCFFPFNSYFVYAFTFPLSFIFIFINLSVYSYIYLIDFHFILKKLTQFSGYSGTTRIVK